MVRKKYGHDAAGLVEALDKLAFGPKQQARVRLLAIKELLDRGWGTPVQSHQLLGPDGTKRLPTFEIHFGSPPTPPEP